MATNIKTTGIIGITYQTGEGVPTHSEPDNTQFTDLLTNRKYIRINSNWIPLPSDEFEYGTGYFLVRHIETTGEFTVSVDYTMSGSLSSYTFTLLPQQDAYVELDSVSDTIVAKPVAGDSPRTIFSFDRFFGETSSFTNNSSSGADVGDGWIHKLDRSPNGVIYNTDSYEFINLSVSGLTVTITSDCPSCITSYVKRTLNMQGFIKKK